MNLQFKFISVFKEVGGSLNALLIIKIEKTKIPLAPMVKIVSGGKHTVRKEGCYSCLFFIVFKVISMLSFSYCYFLSSAL